jgi:cell division protein FtsL
MKAMMMLLGLALIFLFVWERVDVVRLGYQIERLKAQKVLLIRERDQLQVKVSVLAAPERIAKVATEKLGLVPPQQGQVFLVRQQQEAPMPASPAPEQIRVARNHQRTGVGE